MGAVQKLATVVMIGLVALATVFLVYAANEPNRRDTQVTRQDDLAIERGTELFITYCLQCHAPDGTGYMEGTGRIGGVLNQSKYPDTSTLQIVYQSNDPAMQAKAEHFIRYRLENGAPGDPRQPLVMPAFGQDLNVEQINDLVYLIMHVDWNYVYNESVLTTGHNEQTAVCATDPSNAICSEKEPAAYPTVPPTPVPAATPAASGDSGTASTTESSTASSGDAGTASGAPVLELDAQDVSWSQKDITLKPGDTFTLKNTGVLLHDFVVDELGIKVEVKAGESTTVTIPADAKPGTYTFYCSQPGHKESGMVGTLTIGS
ncbi:MAG TPA: plastocyanin/azurin family copper-binding protein [Thermomicrobiales bacterium]|nr:plastocyanin/azurin family copper-binding protein [Thermomicrobiales bacterium]